MAYKRSDPEVTGWMKDNPDAVERVSKLYGLLKDMGLEKVVAIAAAVGVDVDKRLEQCRDGLITDIVKVGSDRALKLALGQGTLVPDSDVVTNKGH